MYDYIIFDFWGRFFIQKGLRRHLSSEVLGSLSGVVLRVRGDVSTTDILDGDVLDVESDVVSGESFRERLVVHLDGLNFSGDLGWGKGDDHT